MISFVTTRVAQATIALAGAYLLAAPAAYGAAPGRVVVPPVFPLALVQQVTLPSMPLGAPAVGAGLAVVALAEGDVVAFDLATGTETWRAQLKATHRAVVAGDAVYVVTADTTECLALADGAVRWRTPRAQAATTAPFVTDQSVIIATAEPGVTALVRATGTVSWTRVLSHPITQPFVGATGRVFGISARPEVTALDAATGAVLWSLAFNATLSGLAESANRVYVGSDDNFFYALNAASGRIDW
ncbi:MAG: PQQ-binding-like beta-propeller repeat protein, partial [Acidobacteria bacterium]|nr:PQQ-binding-like beta-propeller repeat protein [Acidobacteriota bacterium]